jgi:hypothetical protein
MAIFTGGIKTQRDGGKTAEWNGRYVLNLVNTAGPDDVRGAIRINVPSACAGIKKLVVDASVIKGSPHLHQALIHLLIEYCERTGMRVPALATLHWMQVVVTKINAFVHQWLI